MNGIGDIDAEDEGLADKGTDGRSVVALAWPRISFADVKDACTDGVPADALGVDDVTAENGGTGEAVAAGGVAGGGGSDAEVAGNGADTGESPDEALDPEGDPLDNGAGNDGTTSPSNGKLSPSDDSDSGRPDDSPTAGPVGSTVRWTVDAASIVCPSLPRVGNSAAPLAGPAGSGSDDSTGTDRAIDSDFTAASSIGTERIVGSTAESSR